MTGHERDCLFFVADAAMADVIDGFMSRGHIDRRIGCRQFAFEFEKDLLVGSKLGGYTDGGVHMHCHRLLQENGYMESHRRLVVMLDQQFGGERPAAGIRAETLGRLCSNGWGDDRADVIVIDPELEVWIWQDSPHVANAVGYSGIASFRESVLNDQEWPDGRDKPLRPKELFQQLCRRHRTPYSSALYRDVVKRVSVRNCNDPAFQQLVETLQRWFPMGGEA
jgi:hypothetical protein